MAELSSKPGISRPVAPLDRYALVAPKAPDRLPPMLFLAALIHGILIIGVTFNAFLGDEFRDAISLEVTIVADPDPNLESKDEAEYLAQASQEGAGNTRDQVRPSALAESNVPIDNTGRETGTSLDDATRHEASADQVIASRREQELLVAEAPRDEPQPDESTAIALEAGVETSLPLPQHDRANLLISGENPRRLVTSVDTVESKVAGYLSRWKQKIEAIGVNYFPEKGIIQGMTGSPTLEVTISAAGELEGVVLRRSSGSRVIDQAALNILRRAAPFEPFPEAIRLDYDELVFAYKWQFSESDLPATASAN